MANEPGGRLAGKVCVVTGTGGSMGRAAALTFAREGASVVGCDVAVEPAEETVKMVHAAGGDLVFYLTRAAWPQLKASRGVVVNMASLNGSLSFSVSPGLIETNATPASASWSMAA
jgi:NAD(P)-dependent dehydrogenase (short-subunit alcohol dehydrogenase family)